MILSKYDQQFLEENKDLIESEDWQALYSRLRNSSVKIRLYDILKDAGIDLLNDYNTCPNGCAAHCENLPKDLYIPEGIESIGAASFFQTAVEKVHLPATVKEIGAGAFAHCEDLTEINIPAAIETIGLNAFRSCTSLREVKFAKTSNLYCIDEGVFRHSGLEKITLPEGIKTIRTAAFNNCYFLTELGLPKSLTKIMSGAIQGVQFFKKITYAGTKEQFKKIDLEEYWVSYQDEIINVNCSDGILRILAGEVVG